MQTEPKFPHWLIFVDHAPDNGALLRLLVLNPFNDAPCTFVNAVIETDPPSPAMLFTESQRAARTRDRL